MYAAALLVLLLVLGCTWKTSHRLVRPTRDTLTFVSHGAHRLEFLRLGMTVG